MKSSIKNRLSSLVFLILLSLGFLLSCNNPKGSTTAEHRVRHLIDTIGFSQYDWQMDSIMSRISIDDKVQTDVFDKVVICPHDDYAYAGGLYRKTLAGIKAKTILLIGVAHKARNFSLENKLVFGDFQEWKGTYGKVAVSPLRDKIIKKMSPESFMVHDSMMQLEHSLEAITPFLQYSNKEVEIIPVLVPYFEFEKMEAFSSELADALFDIMKEENLNFGKDVAIVISNDAIHYGDEEWGGSQLAPFGVDSLGTAQAKQKDLEIISNCLQGELSHEKIKLFNSYTVNEDSFKEYKWTWCGRYSVPFGLLTAKALNERIEHKALNGELVDYRTSFHNIHIEVIDLCMGTTDPAYQRNWVGYVGMIYN